MNYKRAFHTAYLKQQNVEDVTEENILEFSVGPERLVLLDETERYWIIKTLDDGCAGEFVNVVFKASFEMETIAME